DINTNVGDADDRIVVADEDGVLKSLKAAMPKFFYMPSIIVPTSEEQLNNPASGQVTGDAFDDNTLQGTINLYGRYEAQFGTPMVSNGGSTTTLPVLPATELDYHITWYDTNVFTLVSVSDSGVLTYTVDGNADITVGSFMNILNTYCFYNGANGKLIKLEYLASNDKIIPDENILTNTCKINERTTYKNSNGDLYFH